MTYLISGAHSFIGKAIAKQHECSSFDRGLFEDDQALKSLVSGFDTVINFSAYGNHYHQKDTTGVWRVNAGYATQLAMHAKKLINFSTSSVFLEKQTQYSLSKRVAECVMKQCGHITVRPSSVTGVGEHSFHLIPMLIRSCLYGYSMPFVEWATHDYVDVNDIASAIPFLKDGEYNISSGKIHTNKQVLEIVEDITKKKANTEIVNSLRTYDTEKWEVDNSRLASFGWKPKILLEESIKQMADEEFAKKVN